MLKYTTVALTDNQHLILRKKGFTQTLAEKYCFGYENGKRSKELDGWYYVIDLKLK